MRASSLSAESFVQLRFLLFQRLLIRPPSLPRKKKSRTSLQGPQVGVGSPAAPCAHFIIWKHTGREGEWEERIHTMRLHISIYWPPGIPLNSAVGFFHQSLRNMVSVKLKMFQSRKLWRKAHRQIIMEMHTQRGGKTTHYWWFVLICERDGMFERPPFSDWWILDIDWKGEVPRLLSFPSHCTFMCAP